MAAGHAFKLFPLAGLSSFSWSAHPPRQRASGANQIMASALSRMLRPGRPKLAIPASGKVFMPLSPFHSVTSFHTPGLGREVLLQQRAHYMRFHQTPSEALLWTALRGRRLGVTFRRQVVIGNAIVDFCAPAAAVVVEVDGDNYHRHRRSADDARDQKLVRAGYTVVRLRASLVERNLPAAVALVEQALPGAA